MAVSRPQVSWQPQVERFKVGITEIGTRIFLSFFSFSFSTPPSSFSRVNFPPPHHVVISRAESSNSGSIRGEPFVGHKWTVEYIHPFSLFLYDLVQFEFKFRSVLRTLFLVMVCLYGVRMQFSIKAFRGEFSLSNPRHDIVHSVLSLHPS